MTEPNIDFKIEQYEGFAVLEFTLESTQVSPAMLKDVKLPAVLDDFRGGGIVISGRGPVWLFAHLTHLAHTFAWVGTYDPRLAGAVVVQSHVSGGPAVGTVVPVLS